MSSVIAVRTIENITEEMSLQCFMFLICGANETSKEISHLSPARYNCMSDKAESSSYFFLCNNTVNTYRFSV